MALPPCNLALQSKSLGRLNMGTHDMPLKYLEGTASQTWGEGGLMELMTHGKASRTGIGAALFNIVHTRTPNVVRYTSPKTMNIVAKLAFSPDEAQTAPNNNAVHGSSVAAVKVTGGVKLGNKPINLRQLL